jgi:phosphoglycerate dehydrogenase-like enzyme
MTAQAAEAAAATLVSKNDLFEQADFVTIHVVFSCRTRGLIGAAELARMKPTARLINTSRGPIVEEQALISVLKNRQIAGAAIDVFDVEPLPPDQGAGQHPGNTTCRLCLAGSLQDLLWIPSRTFGRGSTPVRQLASSSLATKDMT